MTGRYWVCDYGGIGARSASTSCSKSRQEATAQKKMDGKTPISTAMHARIEADGNSAFRCRR